MNARVRLILTSAAIGLAGCAASPHVPESQARFCGTDPGKGVTQPQGKASIPYSELEPKVFLSPGLGLLSGDPPIEAVHLYAQARIALMDQQRAVAIGFLEKAIAADPLSFELHATLGRLYVTPPTDFSDRSLRVLERAALLEPDHLGLQTDLGRQYISKGDLDSALKHLRLALLTHEYSLDISGASVAEFFLATLLRNGGYDRAALEVYQQLNAHLDVLSIAAHVKPEATPLLEHADAIEGEIADLLVRTGQFPQAATAFAAQVEKFPGNFDLRARQVHLLLAMHRTDNALHAAEEAAIHFHADAASITLLNEACLSAGLKDGAAGALSRLHESRPLDRAIVYALVDVLRENKQTDQAEKLLGKAAAQFPDDIGILRRRFALVLEGSQSVAAARLLIEATAKDPDLTLEAEPLWSILSRPSARGRLRYSDVAAITVPADQYSAKWYWVSRLAASAHRDDVVSQALDRAASDQPGPGFGPAYLEMAERIWDRLDLDTDAKQKSTNDLTAGADFIGGVALADEVQAISLLRQHEPDAALTLFDSAISNTVGKHSPALALKKAETLRKTGNDSAADSLLWKLVSDHPFLSEAYLNLYLSSLSRGIESQAEHVVTLWLAADPDSVPARRIQAIQYQRAGRNDAAEAILVRLFREHPDDVEAIAALEGFYVRRQQMERMIPLLQERHAADSDNYAVSSALANVLFTLNRTDDATHVLDSARESAARDPDLLYSLSGLYARIGQKQTAEEILRDVLKIDSTHISAANDLGYMWAERGDHLTEAEALVRKAVEVEPHNVSFLDSMGWLLYKRGQFAEARIYLDRAIGKQGSAEHTASDPVLLDHRGDLLYRLGEKEAAAVDWQNAADQIVGAGEDAGAEMKALREQLLEKTRRQKSGATVPVSPTGKGERLSGSR